MRRLAAAGMAGILLGLAGCGGHTVEMLKDSRDFQRRGALDLVLDLPAGKTVLARGTQSHLYDLRFSYCRTHFTARARFEPAPAAVSPPQLGAARLRIEARPTVSDFPAREEPNLIDLRLRPGVPLDLRLASGGSLQLDLTGLSVRRLVLHAGSSPSSLAFKAGNPIDLELLRVIGGDGALVLTGLGWGQVKSLQFHGGAGDARLDFSGPGPAEGAALLDPGTGRVELSFPADLGVEITGHDLDPKSPPAGFHPVDRGWLSDNLQQVDRRLTLLVEGGGERLMIHWLP